MYSSSRQTASCSASAHTCGLTASIGVSARATVGVPTKISSAQVRISGGMCVVIGVRTGSKMVDAPNKYLHHLIVLDQGAMAHRTAQVVVLKTALPAPMLADGPAPAQAHKGRNAAAGLVAGRLCGGLIRP